MSETTQTYLGLESTSTPTNPGFQSVLNYIRERATSEYRKGELFERLMLTYLTEDPDYKEQFSEVYLYKQWAAQRTDFDANDIGIDLVAKERHGGYCAIQCKCYAEDTRISKPALDSFISASASERFTSRLIVDTGGEWGPNALRTIKVYIALTAPERTDSQFMLQRTDSQLSEPFSFTYLLYMRERFSAVGASCARDIARKP